MTAARPRRATWSVVAALWAVAGGDAVEAQEPSEWAVTPAQVERARTQPLFASSDVLELTLRADFRAIRREDRRPDAAPRPATVTLAGGAGPVTLGLEVQTRGNWRLDPGHCGFPPLWLDFDADDPALRGTPFESQNRLKLYVTCRPDRRDFEQYILTEYLIYPVLNLLTDASFRARLASVTYEDSSGRDDTFTSHAFLLEHKSRMAARNEAVPSEVEQLHPALLDQEAAALTEIFQYMVGMTDWNGVFMHNVEPIRRTDGRHLLVPYDFDWSGTVNARYAEPNERLGIRNVRQRIFQGFCRDLDYGRVFVRFTERREQILEVVRAFTPLEEDHRKRVIEYWDDFFEVAADPRRHDRILRDCTRIPS